MTPTHLVPEHFVVAHHVHVHVAQSCEPCRLCQPCGLCGCLPADAQYVKQAAGQGCQAVQLHPTAETTATAAIAAGQR